MSMLSLLLRASAMWMAWPWLTLHGLQWTAFLLLVALMIEELSRELR